MAITSRRPKPADDEGTTEEVEVPRQRGAKPETGTRRGWGQARQARKTYSSSGEFADEWNGFPETATLIKFRESEPFFSVGQHWIDGITEGKRSWYCANDIDNPDDNSCPLCRRGHKARPLSMFNIVPLTGEHAGQAISLVAGPQLTQQLEDEDNSVSGPLSKHFWSVRKSKSGKGRQGKVTYHMSAVKARDLAEDYEMDPAEQVAKIDALALYDETQYRIPSEEDLEEVAVEHLDN